MEQVEDRHAGDLLLAPAEQGLPGRIRRLEIAKRIERAEQVRAEMPGLAARLGAFDHLAFQVGVERAQRRFAADLIGDVMAFGEDAGDRPVILHDRLVDQIQETLLQRAAWRALKVDRHALPDKGLAGTIDLVEQVEKTLAVDLGKRFADRHAVHLPMPDQLEISLVHEFEDVVGAAQHAHEARCPLEQGAEAVAFAGAGLHFGFETGVDLTQHFCGSLAEQGRLDKRGRAPSLAFIGFGTGKAGRYLAREQVEIAEIIGIGPPMGVEADHDRTDWCLPATALERQNHCMIGHFLPGAAREGSHIGQGYLRLATAQGPGRGILQRDRCRGCGMRSIETGSLDQPRHAVLEQIDEGEGEIVGIALQAGTRDRRYRGDGVRRREVRGEQPEGIEPARRDDSIGFLDDRAQQPTHRAVIVEDRAVGEGVIGFFAVAVAFKQQQQRFAPCRFAGFVDRPDQRLDIGPDLRPEFGCRRGQPVGMLSSKCRAIGIIVEEGDVRSPSDPHVELAGEQDADCDAQCFGPVFDRTERRSRPILGAHQRRHLARADEQVRTLFHRRIRHVRRSGATG
ncbi:hypothetical protein MGWOODY_Smn1837 [hydrothermal vent metagenome]|uniref:Uncharacterized protein n=1 Tax=hydrothermal vent metagenome TaxID=652676 RepID=A0A160TMV1_9ZZZZ